MFEFETGNRQHVPEPDLVPILDGLTSVIFFLLLSISFIGLTKITVPPSASSVVTASDSKKPPLSPKLKVKNIGNELHLELAWLGEKPDQKVSKEVRNLNRNVLLGLIEKVKVLSTEFKEIYPEEKTIQLAMSQDLNYQEMISIMDGLRPVFDDIVLNSYNEVE